MNIKKTASLTLGLAAALTLAAFLLLESPRKL